MSFSSVIVIFSFLKKMTTINAENENGKISKYYLIQISHCVIEMRKKSTLHQNSLSKKRTLWRHLTNCKNLIHVQSRFTQRMKTTVTSTKNSTGNLWISNKVFISFHSLTHKWHFARSTIYEQGKCKNKSIFYYNSLLEINFNAKH